MGWEIPFFVVVTVFDLCGAAIIAAGLAKDRWRTFPVWHRFGLAIGAIGLTAQAGRNIQFLVTGVSATDADLPLWAFKDLAIATIAIGYACIAYAAWKATKDAPVRARVKAPVKAKPKARRR